MFCLYGCMAVPLCTEHQKSRWRKIVQFHLCRLALFVGLDEFFVEFRVWRSLVGFTLSDHLFNKMHVIFDGIFAACCYRFCCWTNWNSRNDTRIYIRAKTKNEKFEMFLIRWRCLAKHIRLPCFLSAFFRTIWDPFVGRYDVVLTLCAIANFIRIHSRDVHLWNNNTDAIERLWHFHSAKVFQS